MGPCPEAIEAIHKVVPQGGRYLYNETFAFIDAMAEIEGLSTRSRDAVRRLERPAPPGRAGLHRAREELRRRRPRLRGRRAGRPVHRRQDDQGPAPQGLRRTTSTPWPRPTPTPASSTSAIPTTRPARSRPRTTSSTWSPTSPRTRSSSWTRPTSTCRRRPSPASPLVAADKDVIILRTFSKLYGMAGLRAGAALGRPDLLAKIRELRRRGAAGHRHGRRDRQPQGQGPGRTAAQDHRRHPRGDGRVAREEGIRRHAVGSEHDHDRRPPAGPRGLRRPCSRRRSAIGRTWPSMPNHVRVSIGTREEMAKFRAAFGRVMNV